MSDAPTQRLFFALWPDTGIRQAMQKRSRLAVRKAGGRPVLPRNYHVTLAFLGAVPRARFNDICAAAHGIHWETFELALDRFGYWPRPKLLWLGASAPPRPLHDLVEAIWTAMADLGFEREQRIFRPHVSLCRKLHRQPELDPPEAVSWSVDSFALVESETDPRGSRYAVAARFSQAHVLTQ